MNRKKFFEDYEVLRTRRRRNGTELPEHQILLKLRKPGERPMWKLKLLEEYHREMHFRDVTSLARYN